MSGSSAAALGASGEQLKALERLRDYPKRHARLKKLWIDINGGGHDWNPGSPHNSTITPTSSLGRSRRLSGSSSVRHGSGSRPGSPGPAAEPTPTHERRRESRGRASPTGRASPVASESSAKEAPARKVARRESPAPRREAPAAAPRERPGRREPAAPKAKAGRAPAGRPLIRRDGPLTRAEIRELMTRDLTPEDYELLLLLDEGVKKAPTLSSGAAAALPSAVGTDWHGEACMICLCALEEDEDVRRMPGCGHMFHAACAARWLSDSKSSCPVCGKDEAVMEKCIQAFMQFDHNCDGLCDVNEMKAVLTKLDAATWTSENVDTLFSHVDVNKDGKIDTREFVNWLFAADAGGEQTRLRESMKIT
mmetsp:Transcript_110036/g.206289  ORF Transcript_110036/g.206289 Transcript_110036/m.206289 type:complete len:365 (-) Transcript_110036:211-1305(-)